MHLQIHLSGAKRTTRETDVMTAWFGKGVGLVKYVERQNSLRGRPGRGHGYYGRTGILRDQAAEALTRRARYPRREGLLADDASDHELRQVLFTPGFRSTPDSRWPPNGWRHD